MKQCSKCDKRQVRLNAGDLCTECHKKAKSDAVAANVGFAGLSAQQIDALPELPANWDTKSLTDLTAGHLLKLMMCFYKPLQEKVELLEKQNKEQETKIAKNVDVINELQSEADGQRKEVDTLKKVIYNQQIYLEGLRKKESANNIIVTGIPNNDLEYNDMIHTTTEEKVLVVLKELNPTVSAEAFKLIKFNPADGRDTHVCKLVFHEYRDKMNIYTKAKLLKENAVLHKIFLKWDEPRLTRLENQRMRTKKYKLGLEFPDEDIVIKKGILYRSGVNCDKFNLSNQIF